MLQPVDSSILHEIVRIIESRRKVPERVQARGREYQITYLEDHQRRLEEALHRFDSDQLNMLYGQLASKVKYQLLRRVPARAVKGKKEAPGRRAPAAKGAQRKPGKKAVAKATRPAKRRPAEKRAARKPAVKKAPKKAAKTKKKAPARKAGGKKTGTAKK